MKERIKTIFNKVWNHPWRDGYSGQDEYITIGDWLKFIGIISLIIGVITLFYFLSGFNNFFLKLIYV